LVSNVPPEIDADTVPSAVLRLDCKGRRDLRADDQLPRLGRFRGLGPGLRRLGEHHQGYSRDNGANSGQCAPFLAFHAAPRATMGVVVGTPFVLRISAPVKPSPSLHPGLRMQITRSLERQRTELSCRHPKHK